MDSQVEELKIAATSLEILEFSDVNSDCRLIEFVRDGRVNELKISCHIDKLVIKELPKISLTKEGKIDLIELEDINKKILRKYEKEIVDCNKNGHIDDDLSRYKSIVLATYEAFENQKMFTESDICLFEIRRLGIMIKKVNKSLPIKCLLTIEKFFTETCFGWGINILNNIITMIFIISGFSVAYYAVAYYKGEMQLHFEKCFEIAINRFFLIGSDEFNYAFFPYLDSIESIIGIMLLTVITGVLVRKIIR